MGLLDMQFNSPELREVGVIVLLALLGILLVLVFVLLMFRRHKRPKDPLEDRKSEFISLAAHYFMTPLAIIRGNIAELTDPSSVQLTKSQLHMHYLNIEVNVGRLILLMQNIIVTSAIDQGTLKVTLAATNVADMVADCVTEVHAAAMQKGLHVRFDRPEHVRVEQVRTDAEKLRQALTNILDNAVKFTKEQGTIVVSLQEQSNMYIIRVSDSGVGIARNEMGKLFTRFHRGTSFLSMDYDGIGLGLYLAKYLIEACRGKLELASEFGKGTAVTISLPR